jgi:hypothetical protein
MVRNIDARSDVSGAIAILPIQAKIASHREFYYERS